MTVDYIKQAAQDPALSNDPEFAAALKSIVGNDDDLKNSENFFAKQDVEKLVKAYLEETVPKDVLDSDVYKFMWAAVGKTIKLSFIDKKDMAEFESLFNIAKNHYIMSIPVYKYTYDTQRVLSQLRIYFMAALSRAVGSPTHKINERTMQASSINQVIRSNSETMDSGKKNKFLGLF